MPTFRRKLVKIDAVQWAPPAGPVQDGATVTVDDGRHQTQVVYRGTEKGGLWHVLMYDGGAQMLVLPGDWIMVDSQGIRHVWRDAHFQPSYEPVPAEPTVTVPVTLLLRALQAIPDLRCCWDRRPLSCVCPQGVVKAHLRAAISAAAAETTELAPEVENEMERLRRLAR